MAHWEGLEMPVTFPKGAGDPRRARTHRESRSRTAGRGLVLRKFLTRPAVPEMGGKAGVTASSPETDQGPGGKAEAAKQPVHESSAGMRAHQSSSPARRQPNRDGLDLRAKRGRLSRGTWLVFPAGPKSAPAKIVPVVSRQGRRVNASSLPSRTSTRQADGVEKTPQCKWVG